MHRIKVDLPFTVRLADGRAIHLAKGVHELESDVLQHWFVQACLDGGRAVLLGSNATLHQEQEVEVPLLREEQLMGMTNRQLATLAQERGINLPAGAAKRQMVECILAFIAEQTASSESGEA